MIQIDMQMPKNCIDCPACNEYLMCAIPCNGRGWGENDVKDFSQSRPEWCPMKEQEAVEPYSMNAERTYGICPKCGKIIFRYGNVEENHYCGVCGQAVKWE